MPANNKIQRELLDLASSEGGAFQSYTARQGKCGLSAIALILGVGWLLWLIYGK